MKSTCRFCEKELPTEAKFCLQCGRAQVEQMGRTWPDLCSEVMRQFGWIVPAVVAVVAVALVWSKATAQYQESLQATQNKLIGTYSAIADASAQQISGIQASMTLREKLDQQIASANLELEKAQTDRERLTKQKAEEEALNKEKDRQANEQGKTIQNLAANVEDLNKQLAERNNRLSRIAMLLEDHNTAQALNLANGSLDSSQAQKLLSTFLDTANTTNAAALSQVVGATSSELVDWLKSADYFVFSEGTQERSDYVALPSNTTANPSSREYANVIRFSVKNGIVVRIAPLKSWLLVKGPDVSDLRQMRFWRVELPYGDSEPDVLNLYAPSLANDSSRKTWNAGDVYPMALSQPNGKALPERMITDAGEFLKTNPDSTKAIRMAERRYRYGAFVDMLILAERMQSSLDLSQANLDAIGDSAARKFFETMLKTAAKGTPDEWRSVCALAELQGKVGAAALAEGFRIRQVFVYSKVATTQAAQGPATPDSSIDIYAEFGRQEDGGQKQDVRMTIEQVNGSWRLREFR